MTSPGADDTGMSVLTATMPQPISTPTAYGTTAFFVAKTQPIGIP